jgi:hypothetical protein
MSLLSREVWGPEMWKMLHIFADNSGSITDKILENDEAHIWISLIRNLSILMPCQLCSQHYKAWTKRFNLNEIILLRGLTRNIWLTDFFWNLHNDVNTRNNKSVFNKEDLKKYSDRSEFAGSLDLIKRMVAKAIEQGSLEMIATKTVLINIEKLRKLYSF